MLRSETGIGGVKISTAPDASSHPIMEQARDLEAYLRAETHRADEAGAAAAAAHEEAEAELMAEARRVTFLGGVDVGGPGALTTTSLWDEEVGGGPVTPAPAHGKAAETVRRAARKTRRGQRTLRAKRWGVRSTLPQSRRPSFLETVQSLGQSA